SRFLSHYIANKIMENDPFQVLDQEGVGELVRIGVERGRRTRPDLKIGICGEHGGEPKSIAFCHDLNLDYVSCSPYRVPIARLSAAQAVLMERERTMVRTDVAPVSMKDSMKKSKSKSK
ncbi:MAG: pyruvate,orthophosphate dikinase, partial [Cellvibrionaceae bacterium]